MSRRNDSGLEGKRIPSSLTEFIDDNVQLFRSIPYVIALTGLLVAGRNIRLTNQFRSVSEIPSDFFQRNLWLRGRVSGVRGMTLQIRHEPIFKRKSKSISESCADLNISLYKVSSTVSPSTDANLSKSSLSLAPLAPELVDKNVWFRLVGCREIESAEYFISHNDPTSDVDVSRTISSENQSTSSADSETSFPQPISCADCVVTYRRPTFVPFISRKILLNEAAILLGLAPLRTTYSVSIDSGGTLYCLNSKRAEEDLKRRLTKAEQKASKKRIGIWACRGDGGKAGKLSLWSKLKSRIARRRD